ncbi:ribonuclease H-like domain-containing protein [Tanacetum coccineum]
MLKDSESLNQLKAKLPEDEDINLSSKSLPLSWLRSQRSGNVIEDVLQSFVADTKPEQQLAYEDFDQIEKLDLEEMDLKWQMAMLSVRVHKFEQKAGRKIDFDKKESARFNKKKVRCYKCLQRGHFARECRAKGGNDKQRYSSFKIQEIGKKEEDSKALITIDTLVDWTEHDGQSDGVIAPKESPVLAAEAGEFALILEFLQKNQLPLEDKIRVLSIELENTTNLLKHSERINAIVETAKKELQTKLDNTLSTELKKRENPSKNCSIIEVPLTSLHRSTTSESEAEIESNVGTKPIQEPIIVQEETNLDNATRSHQSNQFVPQAVLLRSGKVSIPAARPNKVPAGRPKPVSTGRPNHVSTVGQNQISTVHQFLLVGLLAKGQSNSRHWIFKMSTLWKNCYNSLVSPSLRFYKKNKSSFTDSRLSYAIQDFILPDEKYGAT